MHTKGPWKHVYDPPEVLMGGHQRSWRVLGQLPPYGTAQHIADCYNNVDSEANARLIASAPELYEALDYLTKEIDLNKLNIRKDFSLINAHACALKALYKVNGGE